MGRSPGDTSLVGRLPSRQTPRKQHGARREVTSHNLLLSILYVSNETYVHFLEFILVDVVTLLYHYEVVWNGNHSSL